MKNVHEHAIEVVRTIQKYEKIQNENVTIVETERAHLTLAYKGPGNFFFQIESYQLGQRRTTGGVTPEYKYKISYRPQSERLIEPVTTHVPGERISFHLNQWLALLDTYNSLSEDPVLKQSAQEFYAEFELVDEDAESTYFHHNQQLYIDNYLDGFIKLLEAKKTEINAVEIDAIIEDAKDLQDNQTNYTKKVVVERISRLAAKCKKAGIKVLQSVWDETKSQVIKEIVKGTVTNPTRLIETITSWIS
jgi:hypothetical protein